MIEVAISQRLGAHLQEVRFSAPSGVVSVFGPSGAGKTSLLRAVAGLSRPDSGRIVVGDTLFFDGETDLSPAARRVGYVFQDARLFPHLSVLKNLRYGGRHDEDAVIDLLGLAPLLERAPRHLSGGEAQRVAIGRALMRDPQILLLDEPLASLDPRRRSEILPYLERLRDHANMPILHVSHDIGEVSRLASTVVVLDAGQVVRAGPAPEVLSDPHMADYLGARGVGALLSAQVVAYDPRDDMTELALRAGRFFVPGRHADIGARLRLRISAEDVIIAARAPDEVSALNILPVLVEDTVSTPDAGVRVVLRLGQDRLVARLTRRSVTRMNLQPGKEVFALIKATAVLSGAG